MAGSYYDVLGVSPQASPEAIRQAYRQRARALHPDRHSAAAAPDAAQAGRAMQEVNEAWQVLGDAGRRSAYDRSLVASAGPSPAPAGPGRRADDDDDRPYPQRLAQPGDVGISLVRGLPWMAVVVVLVGIFIFTAFAGGSDDEEPSASELIGSCVVLESGGVVTEVPCDVPSDGRVDLVVVRSSLCPDGSDVVRMPGERSWLCLRDPDRPRT